MWRRPPPAVADLRTVVVCPDKLRGSLGAAAAAAALAGPLRARGLAVVERPLSDGGEGFLDIVTGARAARPRSVGPGAADAQWRTSSVAGPSGDERRARWYLGPDGEAVAEAALVCGHLDGAEVDPIGASTAGVGELLADARDSGARRLVLGIGGTVTTDGGLGAVEALGWDLGDLEVVVAVDTEVRYLDAARVFAPQKHASPAEVEELTDRLARQSEHLRRRTGVDVVATGGSGAGGGLAGGLLALGATIRPGIEVVAEAVQLDRCLRAADLVITGEGRLDRTSLGGKAVGWVLERSRPGRRAVVVGQADRDAVAELEPDVGVAVLRDAAVDDADSTARASELLARAASELAPAVVA